MNRPLIVRSWDRPRLFELDPAGGELVRCRAAEGSDATDTDGFVKSCLLGPPLVIYRHETTWIFQVGRHRWPLADPDLKIVVKRWFLGRKIEIDAPGFRATCRISDAGFRLGQRLDPTFDRLDHEAADFPFWLATRRAEARRASDTKA